MEQNLDSDFNFLEWDIFSWDLPEIIPSGSMLFPKCTLLYHRRQPRKQNHLKSEWIKGKEKKSSKKKFELKTWTLLWTHFDWQSKTISTDQSIKIISMMTIGHWLIYSHSIGSVNLDNTSTIVWESIKSIWINS